MIGSGHKPTQSEFEWYLREAVDKGMVWEDLLVDDDVHDMLEAVAGDPTPVNVAKLRAEWERFRREYPDRVG